MKTAIKCFLLLGIAPTVFCFWRFSLQTRYGMNPLAYIVCMLPLILALPLLFLKDDDFK